MRNPLRSRANAFTLIELLVVVAIIGLLISILLPSLQRARENTKSVICLSNLRNLGQGVITYASEEGKLPGALHPALYRNQGIEALMSGQYAPTMSYEAAKKQQARFLTYHLRRVFNDSETNANSITDQVSTCPTMESQAADENFQAYYQATGSPAFPTHYVVNNYWPAGGGSGPDGHGAIGNSRPTSPRCYFGYSPYSGEPGGDAKAKANPGHSLDQVKRAPEEWMIADAWFRENDPFPQYPELQQSGPYQFSWSGQPMPYFAPHFSPIRQYSWTDTNSRTAQARDAGRNRQDGLTNTVFFDGHAAPVESRTMTIGDYEVLYGFPGTVNPATELPVEAMWK